MGISQTSGLFKLGRSPDDLEQDRVNEVVQFAALCQVCSCSGRTEFNATQMLSVISGQSLQCTFPNAVIVLSLHLCLTISNYSGDRKLSTLKRIKNAPGSSKNQS